MGGRTAADLLAAIHPELLRCETCEYSRYWLRFDASQLGRLATNHHQHDCAEVTKNQAAAAILCVTPK
jgi:hypothetical protein